MQHPGQPTESSANEQFRPDREVLRSLAVANVDPAPLFCDVLRCRVVDEGGIVRYRDATHVSATYSAAAWSELRALLVAAGAPLP